MTRKVPTITYVDRTKRSAVANWDEDRSNEHILVSDAILRELIRCCEMNITSLRRDHIIEAYEKAKTLSETLHTLLRHNERCTLEWEEEEEKPARCQCDPNLGEGCPACKHDTLKKGGE